MTKGLNLNELRSIINRIKNVDSEIKQIHRKTLYSIFLEMGFTQETTWKRYIKLMTETGVLTKGPNQHVFIIPEEQQEADWMVQYGAGNTKI